MPGYNLYSGHKCSNGVVQESKAEKAMEALQEMAAPGGKCNTGGSCGQASSQGTGKRILSS